MPFYLDDEPFDLGETPESEARLGPVLEAAQRRLEATDRLVVEVQLDGQALDGEQIDTRRDEAIAGVELRLFSADRRELGLEALDQGRQLLDQALGLQQQAAELLQQDRAADAMRHVADVIGLWQHVHQALAQSLALTRVDLAGREFEGRPVLDFAQDLLEHIRTLHELIEAQDTLGLADALQYEWPEMTARWDRLLAETMEWIRAS